MTKINNLLKTENCLLFARPDFSGKKSFFVFLKNITENYYYICLNFLYPTFRTGPVFSKKLGNILSLVVKLPKDIYVGVVVFQE